MTFKFTTAECGGSSLVYREDAMHVATRLIHLYLKYPRTYALFASLVNLVHANFR
jgi:hypothetical protein